MFKLAFRKACPAALVAAIAIAALPLRPAGAAEVAVSHYGELMYGAPWAVALKEGFFKKRGVDVTGFLSSSGGGTTIRNMMASDMPYAETALSAAVSAIHNGIPLVIVDGAVNNAADLVWVTTPKSPVKDIHGLVGKKIAFTRAKSTTELLGTLAIQAAKIDTSKIKLVSLGTIGGGLTGLQEGAVAAAPELEPVFSKNEDKYRVVFRVADLLPPMTQHVGVVSADFLKEHPDKVKAIILARQDGVEYMKAHPKEAAEITAKAYDMPVDVISHAMTRLLKANYWGDGSFDFDAMNRAVAGLHLIGALPDKTVDWSKMVDQSALPEKMRVKVPNAASSE